MPDNFGIKLGIDGEKAFKQALREINQDFKELGSEMKLATSQFDKNDRSVEALAARNEVLNKSIDAQKNKIDTLRQALKNAEESFGENDTRTKKWRTELNNAEAELNDMERELKQNTKDVEENSKAVKDSEGKWGGLGKAVSAAGNAMADSWKSAMEAAGAAAKALVEASVAGAEYSDEVLTQSQVTGIAADKLQEYMYAAELVDVSTETLTGSMARNIRSMSAAANGTGNAAAAYAKLGVSVTDANGELRDSDTVYWELIEALGKVDNETERDALAMQVLGRSAQELNPLIEAGTDRMRELGQEARDTGYVLSDDTLNAYGKLDDSLRRLESGATAAKNAFGQILLPTLDKLGGAGVNALGKFTKALNDSNGDLSQVGDVINEIVPEVLGVIEETIPELITLVESALTAISDALVKNLPQIIDTVVRMFGQVLEALTRMLPKLVSTIVELLKGVTKTIVSNADMIITSVMDLVSTLIVSIGDSLPDLLDMIIDIIEAVAKSLIDNLPTLVESLMKVITSLITTIADSLPRLIRTLADIVTALVKQVPSIIRTLIENLDTIITSLLNGILESIPELIKAVIQVAVELVKATPQIIAELIKMIPKIITGIIDALLDPSNIWELIKAGGEIIVALGKGIWEGLKALGESIIEFFKGIWDSIKSIFSSIWDGIKSIFGFGGTTADDLISEAEAKYGITFRSSAKADLRKILAGITPYNASEKVEKFSIYIENYVANDNSDVEQLAERIMTAAERQALRMGAMYY